MGGHSHPVFKALRAQKLVQVLPGEPAPPRLTLIPHPGSRFRLRDPGTTRQLCERPGLLREPGGQPPWGGPREGVPPGADPLRRQLAWVRDGGWVLMVVGEAVPLLEEKRGEPEMKCGPGRAGAGSGALPQTWSTLISGVRDAQGKGTRELIRSNTHFTSGPRGGESPGKAHTGGEAMTRLGSSES